MKYIDSHCHINDEHLLMDSEAVINSAKEVGVTSLIVIGWDLDSSIKAVELANAHQGVYAAIGFHPENLDEVSEEAILKIEELAKTEKKVVAIGEIGLDYHWFKEESHRNKQKEWFIRQINLANKLSLPVSIHARDASNDTYEILKAHPVKKGAVLHCYSGSVEMMKRFDGLDLYFGFDGPITFKNAVEPKECVKACRLERLLSETDSPYLAPTPFRGKTNKPEYIPHIVKQMAELRGESEEEVTKAIAENYQRLFSVEP